MLRGKLLSWNLTLTGARVRSLPYLAVERPRVELAIPLESQVNALKCRE